jgi:YbgC/YbaW family acyl-CoA thioester hydrolase
MAHEFKIRRMVEFSETDMAGIMHFTNFFRYMEAAEHAFYRSLGLSVNSMESLGCGWPRVKAECEYKRPLRFEEEVEIHLVVREMRNRSIGYEFVFRSGGLEVARGGLTVVCVAKDKATGEMKAVTIPAEVRAKIEQAPASLLANKEK